MILFGVQKSRTWTRARACAWIWPFYYGTGIWISAYFYAEARVNAGARIRAKAWTIITK
jgi:hypothetical protein